MAIDEVRVDVESSTEWGGLAEGLMRTSCYEGRHYSYGCSCQEVVNTLPIAALIAGSSCIAVGFTKAFFASNHQIGDQEVNQAERAFFGVLMALMNITALGTVLIGTKIIINSFRR